VIAVQVSSGTGDVEVPKLIGLSITTAKANLEKLGLTAVVHWTSVGETPTYVVLNQKPAAGEKLKPDAEVQLTACQ
jgi:beta-lactam-binding protein with PASTA domain